jgi:hypothetical protein
MRPPEKIAADILALVEPLLATTQHAGHAVKARP